MTDILLQMNKIAIVTGGASGIGLAIARKFSANDILTIPRESVLILTRRRLQNSLMRKLLFL